MNTSRFQVLAGMSPAQEAELLAQARRRRFRRGDAVFHEGDPGDTVHLIDKGHVAVRITTLLGEVATVRVLGPGALFGEMAVLDPAPRSASVIALSAVETLSLHRDVVNDARRRFPGFDEVLLRASLAEVRRLSAALTDALHLPVPKRLARHLAALHRQFAGGTIPLTQDDLAGLCGTTRQTVNQVLADLQSDGVIELGRGRVTVTDHERLVRAGR